MTLFSIITNSKISPEIIERNFFQPSYRFRYVYLLWSWYSMSRTAKRDSLYYCSATSTIVWLVIVIYWEIKKLQSTYGWSMPCGCPWKMLLCICYIRRNQCLEPGTKHYLPSRELYDSLPHAVRLVNSKRLTITIPITSHLFRFMNSGLLVCKEDSQYTEGGG